ncbi:MAG: T9SS type A sorting domain-containing protein [Bacteroidales bacterium]|nr:T9SS type A sorting domain-containing protein [Bacteroidales bacterium]
MKKLTCLFIAVFILFPALKGISQYRVQKIELPPRGSDDSRFTVNATVMNDDSWCEVTWPAPYYPWELSYDDGEADDLFVYTFAGCMSANKFSPYFAPCIVTGGEIYVGDGSFPGPFLGTSFRVLVYDDDGLDGMPGTALDSTDVTVINYEWVEFEGLTAEINDGDFYLAMKQLAPAPDAAPVGVDTDNPTYFMSYSYMPDTGWVTSPLQDFMIRAWVSGYYEPGRDIDYFEVARFSGFDPDGSPLLGDTTVLETVYEPYYEDFSWESLLPGYYAYGVKTHFTSGVWSDYDASNVVSHGLDFYPPSCFYQSEDGEYLVVCPPLDTLGNVPENLLGLNLYRDGEFIAYYPFLPVPDTLGIELDLLPGMYAFAAHAVYDLTPFGYPGETSQSDIVTTGCFIRYGFALDFLESWYGGNLETNNWTVETPNWQVSGIEGNPAPSAEFSREPVQENYSIALESFPFLADSMTEGQIRLDFDIMLDDATGGGTEFLLVQVWNWENRYWSTVKTYVNETGRFDWMSEHLDITEHAMNQVFRVRFVAGGEDSQNLYGWYLDNIHVFRFCTSPVSLTAYGGFDGIRLDWNGIEKNKWIQWDDGENSMMGIGTGASAEFDVAARWETGQLTYFDGDTLTDVAFFPREEEAIYRIRVWIGPGAANLIYDWEVTDPVIAQWNYIPLVYPIIIDSEQELWVGYHVDTPVGYPAGVDDGPALDGYGNMINFGGWQTLLQQNPDLDYNWNVAAYLRHNMDGHQVKYVIYRSDDDGPYFLRDYSDENFYLDDSVCMFPPWYHGYKVTAIHIFENDTCESGFSNEASDVCGGINDKSEVTFVNIYPNPCYDLIKIESSEEIRLVSLYNSHGQMILRKDVDDEVTGIPVKDLQPGLYLVKVETKKQIISTKLLVMH